MFLVTAPRKAPLVCVSKLFRATGTMRHVPVCHAEGLSGDVHFLGLTNPDVFLTRMHQLFCYIIFNIFLYPVSVTFLLEEQCLKNSAGFTKGIFTHFNNWFYKEQKALSGLKFTNEIFTRTAKDYQTVRKVLVIVLIKDNEKIQIKQLRKRFTKVLS